MNNSPNTPDESSTKLPEKDSTYAKTIKTNIPDPDGQTISIGSLTPMFTVKCRAENYRTDYVRRVAINNLAATIKQPDQSDLTRKSGLKYLFHNIRAWLLKLKS